ncbi:MAG TPA: hypothetical protein VLH10_05020 [Yinghuangia sp.]|nr:hypothetical protein [Yinghuangia sp.]
MPCSPERRGQHQPRPHRQQQQADVEEGRKRWTMRWKAPLNAFQIAFEGRLTPATN